MGSSSKPSRTEVVQSQATFPAYFQPYLEDVLSQAESQQARPYEPFPFPRLVETQPERQAALDALQTEELAKMAQPLYEEGIASARQGLTSLPESDIQSYMNPYQSAVTDQLVRDATERRAESRKGIGSAAAKAGAFGGGRHGVAEGMFDRDTQRQLQDIEERQLAQNYGQALQTMQADKARQLAGGQQIAGMGEAQQKALTEGLIGQEKAATAEQAIAQQARDVGYQEFQEQREFPMQKLAEYSSFIRGHTPPPNIWKSGTVSTPYSPLQSALGGMGAVGSMMFGNKGILPGIKGLMNAEGGPVGYAHGDAVGLEDFIKGEGEEGLSALLDDPKEEVDENKKQLNDAYSLLESYGKIGPLAFNKFIGQHYDDEGEAEGFDEEEQETEDVSVQESGPVPGGLFNVASNMEEQQTEAMAYGGVPGQSYTEDIGMVGGLGAVAGPQMRFAYGGVPGQPYTEDIGMMGGLASIAGPQMRFDNGGGVPEWMEDIGDWWDPISKSMDREKAEFAERTRLGRNKASDRMSRFWDYLTKSGSDPESIASKAAYEKSTQALDAYEKQMGNKGAGTGVVEEEKETISDETFDVQEDDDEALGGLEGLNIGKDDDDVEVTTELKETEDVGFVYDPYRAAAAFASLIPGREDNWKTFSSILSETSDKVQSQEESKAREKFYAARTDNEKTAAQRDIMKALLTKGAADNRTRAALAKIRLDMKQGKTQDALKKAELFVGENPFIMKLLMGDEQDPLKGIERLNEIIARFGGTSRIDSASGGSIPSFSTGGSMPNAFSNLGISNIRSI